ncbi:TolC family protein [Chryseolinea lacunae]|uniref:TolC family protein n=1 Tax=Chryseolinea lacunae TaxID=2801331 RepID=A0ABS1KPM9_9BACT|nr:TolC family protein [Chryseolinea lacunae]MBL0741178.1 TolC family protein [Chryseolinea lacunae]
MQITRFIYSGLTLLLVFMAGLPEALAQQENLQTLLDKSVKEYPLLKARAADVNSAAQDVKTSTSEYIPRLSVQHQYTYSTNNSVAGSFYPNGGTVISPSGGIRATNIYDGTFGSFTSALLEWNVINFGKVATQVTAARFNREANQAAYDNEIFQHQVRVADAYLLLLIGEKLKDIQQSNLDRAAGFRDVVDAGVRSGMRPGVDSALAYAEYTKAKLLLLESDRNEQAQQYRLMELTGALSDSLSIDSLNFYTGLPTAGDAGPFHVSANPTLRVFQTRMQASQARSTAIGRSFLPSISLVAAGWARGSGVSNQDDSYRTDFSSGTKYQVYNYMIGISTRWTLTDYVPIRHRYKSEQYKAKRDEELYNEQALRVNRQEKEAAMQYGVALEQAHTAPVQLEAAQQAYNQASARYRSGLTDLPTLLQSMLTLNRAEADVAIAYSNAWRSWLMVAAARGDLSLFLSAVKN